MSLGPVELLAIRFPGNQFSGEIVPALQNLVTSGTIRIIDLVFATKDSEGNVAILELNELDDETYSAYEGLTDEVRGLLSEEDVEHIAGALDLNSSAGLMLFENTWATTFAEAIRNAKGEVLIAERIPLAVIEQMVAAQAEI